MNTNTHVITTDDPIFPMTIEEACRQWCDGIENAPERMDGEGFYDFFLEIYDQKAEEYQQQVHIL